jgi:hypothetical protein
MKLDLTILNYVNDDDIIKMQIRKGDEKIFTKC